MEKHKFIIAETADGVFHAISTETPLFCLSADSLEAARKKANDALDDYTANRFKPLSSISTPKISVEQVRVRRREEHAAA